MTILIFLPTAAFVLFFAACPAQKRCWRAAFTQAALYWGVAVFAITEILSLFHWVTRAGLGCAWLLIDVAVAAGVRRARSRSSAAASGACTALKSFESTFRKFDDTAASYIAVVLILALVGLTALLYPPNAVDVMAYHMPRIVHWLHNRAIGFYATHVLRQLMMPPWAEYAILQFHALSGGDRFDNLVQWFAMLGSIIGVSRIAQLLGAQYRGQVLAALLCASIPEGILEASGAKNDYVLAFWHSGILARSVRAVSAGLPGGTQRKVCLGDRRLGGFGLPDEVDCLPVRSTTGDCPRAFAALVPSPHHAVSSALRLIGAGAERSTLRAEHTALRQPPGTGITRAWL
ncbi:MAG TPA: hypothetical protein VEN79_16160 [Terriglobia bacterium]|nr:hypothetical protein [Terriglobia bacterium]